MTSTMPRASGKRGPQSRLPSRWVALALLASAQLMLVLDVTVVNVALPDIGAALHLQRGELPWVMTIYTVFFGGLMLLGGRIADLFGARRMTLGGLALFTAASLLCGLSGDAATLLAGRSLQGLGAALMSPAALAAVMTLFTGASRGKALGVWSALAGVGSALGVVLGGVLTSEAGWRWVFTINVPIGVALLIAIPLAVPARPPSEAAERGLDVPGAVLVTAGTAAAIYGLINVGSHGWAAASTVLPLVLAVAIWTVFALLERRVRRPLLTVGLLRRRAVLAGSFLMLAATGLLVGGFFLGSFALQHAHGYSALHVGLVFLPVAVATIAGAQAGTQVLTRLSARIVAVTGLALAAAGYAVAAGWTQPAVDGDRAEHRRPRDRGDVRHRLHRLARRCRPGRRRHAISAGQHVPRTRRRGRRRRPVQRRRGRPGHGPSRQSRLRPRLHRGGGLRGGLAGDRGGTGPGRPLAAAGKVTEDARHQGSSHRPGGAAFAGHPADASPFGIA